MTDQADPLPALLAELREVLEEERRTLVSGSAAAIMAVTQRKLTLAETIEHEVTVPGTSLPSIETLTRLARYNRENEIICSAMLRHLTAALDRLRRIDLHRSYNPDGSEQRSAARHALGAA
jgi:flagellar biosynthesis/type III secretory pathway chaperone